MDIDLCASSFTEVAGFYVSASSPKHLKPFRHNVRDSDAFNYYICAAALRAPSAENLLPELHPARTIPRVVREEKAIM